MRIKITFCAILLVIAVVFTACESTDTSHGKDAPAEKLTCDFDENYTVEKLRVSQFKAKEPAGVCKFGDKLVICDRANHKLSVADMDLNYVDSVGRLGSAPGEFMEPTGITAYENQLYVLDAGNSRIQIFDENFEYIRSIALEPLAHHQGGFRYLDIAVNSDGVIYVSCNCVSELDAYIYVIENEKISKSDKRFMGFLTEYNGEVYAVETYELYADGNVEGGASGENHLYRMNGTKEIEIAEIPNKYTPSDFTFLNDKIYMLSGAWGQLFEFSSEGIANKGVSTLENFSIEMYITAINDTDFIVTNYEAKEIYHISYAK